jgi:Holliday junction resolvase
MANSRKQKGTRVEHKVRKLFEELGIKARRQPMSGAIPGLPHDVYADIMGGLSVECKARKGSKGFITMERWQGNADLLVLVADYQEPRVQMRWRKFKELLGYVISEHAVIEGQKKTQDNSQNSTS